MTSKVSGFSPRILIVGPNWVGDMVMAQSLFMTLKQGDQSCRIDVLAPAWTLPLLDSMPEVSNAIEIPIGRGRLGLSARFKLGRMLRSHQYDQSILLPNSWKSALIPYFAGIPIRTGYVGEQRWGLVNDIRRLNKSKLPKTVQRFVALGLEGIAPMLPVCPDPKLIVDHDNRNRLRKKFCLGVESTKILGLCPGAEYGPAKRWPADYFAKIAQQKINDGWEVWLFGSEKDREIAENINRRTGNICRNFSGQTSLAEAVILLSLTDCVLTNDSGLMHVAAALDKRLLALYGSSDPGFTPPLNKHAKVISLSLDCSPCFKRDCPFGHYKCLREMLPERILDEMENF